MQGQKKKRLGIEVLIIVFLGQILYRDNISECKTDYLHGSNRHRSQEKHRSWNLIHQILSCWKMALSCGGLLLNDFSLLCV